MTEARQPTTASAWPHAPAPVEVAGRDAPLASRAGDLAEAARLVRDAARHPQSASELALAFSHLQGVLDDLAVVPLAPAELRADLEQRELARPGREAAVAAIRVQLADDRLERVLRRLQREVVQVSPARAVGFFPAAVDLEQCGAEQHAVEAAERSVALTSGPGECRNPGRRLRVGCGPAGRRRTVGHRHRPGGTGRTRVDGSPAAVSHGRAGVDSPERPAPS